MKKEWKEFLIETLLLAIIAIFVIFFNIYLLKIINKWILITIWVVIFFVAGLIMKRYQGKK